VKVEVYRGKDGGWRWRVKARNGRIVADSAEGYRRQADCRKGMQRAAQALTQTLAAR